MEYNNLKKINKIEVIYEWVKTQNQIIKINGELLNSSDFLKAKKQTKNTIKLFSIDGSFKIIHTSKINIEEGTFKILTKLEAFIYFPELNDIYELKKEKVKNIRGVINYKALMDIDVKGIKYKTKYILYHIEETLLVISLFNNKKENLEIFKISDSNDERKR